MRIKGAIDMTNMHTPPHPGEVLKELFIEPMGLSLTEVADALGVTRPTVSSLVNGHRGISPEMALRLAKAFQTTPNVWMGMQKEYDLWQAKQALSALQLDRVKVLQAHA